MYCDPHFSKWKDTNHQTEKYLEELRRLKKVIVTTDRFAKNEIDCERTGYVSVFSIDDIVTTDELRFKFVDDLLAM